MGFPSYWNVTVFYMLVLNSTPTANLVLLLVLVVLIFIPIKYYYPSRTQNNKFLVMSVTHFMSVTELGAGEVSSLITSFADGREGGVMLESVPDPAGGTEEEYSETFELIRDLVDKVLQRIGPLGYR